MNWHLYDKYGEYNKDGYYIMDHDKWHHYAERPKLYKSKKIKAYLWILVPFVGFIMMDEIYKEMGLSSF